MKCPKDTIWFDNILQLCCSDKLLPMNGMGANEQLNAITRLIILTTIILFLMDYEHTLFFLLISMLFIIILYYIQMSNKERFTTNCKNNVCDAYSEQTYINNPKWVSDNKKLMGGANPKTFINPRITNPSHDLEYWKDNNNVVHSAINDDVSDDIYASGYISTFEYPRSNKNNNIQHSTNIIEELELPCLTNNRKPSDYMVQSHRYNPNNVYKNIPVNIPISTNESNPEQFIHTIQPGVYTQNQIIEPIHSNIGISHTQPFQPVHKQINSNGDVYYTELDPYTNKQQYKIPYKQNQLEHNHIPQEYIYDPRFTGYGTNYRSYVDKMTGQPRYYYDDIDNIRMPKYISRNHIDIYPYAETYGPIENRYGIENNNNVRELAHKSFLDSNLQQRNELSERLMRKGNYKAWQNRMAPKYT